MDQVFNYIIIEYVKAFLYIFLFIFILKLIFSRGIKNYHSNWNTLIEDLSFSTEEFYQLFKKELLSQGVSGIDTHDVSLHEGNILSSKRRYIRVKWKEYQYDICAAPFGKGFFISWWLIYKNSIAQILIFKIPFFGKWIHRVLFPITYYKVDTASMFMTYAQSSVLRVIDEITNNKGLEKLPDSERKPILQDIFKR